MNSHYEDKMISSLSYFCNGNSHTWKDSFYIETGPRFWEEQLADNVIFPSPNADPSYVSGKENLSDKRVLDPWVRSQVFNIKGFKDFQNKTCVFSWEFLSPLVILFMKLLYCSCEDS